ncbi:hypothetical protein JG688_00018380 [Phytophthora aleatoria]|uniref:Uncharacterized protein n=1 Tax=Phytophthora aleatoria TaxID=2496075 RepID=A0A8J5IPJ2_9STRA|nr:hypothetical protein JG688_00018380 [Phytophthora aleatoria]
MGRTQRQQLTGTGLPKQGGRDRVVCKHCLTAFGDKTRNDNPPPPQLIAGRDTNYKSHLKRCRYYQEALQRGVVKASRVDQTLFDGFLQQKAARPRSDTIEETSSSTSDKRQRIIREYFDSVFSDEALEEFERLLTHFQADNNLPDRFIEKYSTIRLIVFLNKACAQALPKKKKIDQILDEHSNIEQEAQLLALSYRLEFSGGRLNFLSDVWQNIAKLHLLGCQLAVV